jgi:hypothetical protein
MGSAAKPAEKSTTGTQGSISLTTPPPFARNELYKVGGPHGSRIGGQFHQHAAIGILSRIGVIERRKKLLNSIFIHDVSNVGETGTEHSPDL